MCRPPAELPACPPSAPFPHFYLFPGARGVLSPPHCREMRPKGAWRGKPGSVWLAVHSPGQERGRERAQPRWVKPGGACLRLTDTEGSRHVGTQASQGSVLGGGGTVWGRRWPHVGPQPLGCAWGGGGQHRARSSPETAQK